MGLFKYDLLIMNIHLNRLDARQRLAILNTKCNLCNKNVIVFSLPFVSMWSDKEASRPLHPSTYMMSRITRAHERTHRHTHTRAHTPMHTHARTRAHTHTHACTHVRTHASCSGLTARASQNFAKPNKSEVVINWRKAVHERLPSQIVPDL